MTNERKYEEEPENDSEAEIQAAQARNEKRMNDDIDGDIDNVLKGLPG